MNAPSIDILAMLEADETIDTTKYPVHIGSEPAEPFNSITIFDVEGPHQLTLDKFEILEYPSVQIRLRTTSYVAGWAVMYAIKKSLHGRANETWGLSLYTLITCSSGPGVLDNDKNQRIRLVINFNIQRRESLGD